MQYISISCKNNNTVDLRKCEREATPTLHHSNDVPQKYLREN
jgi:hypothetical protein